ncbi:isochorismatase family protein [Paeniglutamicibacter psychrophenolicus]|uniref:Nicotinamidase-related amidase n=1 Tax=Paeniglutamicibacter psychrophenolicus TaxID=257454 RepID=A0ABS4WCB5_9MICC|nr:isochorismatase family cysteine hydrolase [Paeniglutamicibacter psychrophenolicus]MBP2373254.1 nicotinamidase-related amidase [Paeniglutamicibacter psychrophenolicus]
MKPQDQATVREGKALVLIDMQRIFQEPESQWFVSNYQDVEQNVGKLRDAFDNVIWTRFVRDPQESGAWSDYYGRWDQCREEPASARWDITLPVQENEKVLSLPTFSKWGEELARMTDGYQHLVVAGVATDCCVLSTVLGAVDAGKHVTVVSDACGGATPRAHEQALELMELLSPMVKVQTTGSLRGEAIESP